MQTGSIKRRTVYAAALRQAVAIQQRIDRA
jgi:hypothetical protein